VGYLATVPFIKEVELQNLGLFGWKEGRLTMELSGRPGWEVITGPTGAGKTTFLQAVASVIVGPQLALVGHAEELLAKEAGLGTGEVVVSSADGDIYWGLEWRKSDQPLNRPEMGRVFFSTTPRPEKRGNDDQLPTLAGFGAERRLHTQSEAIVQEISQFPELSKVLTLLRNDGALVKAQEWLQHLLFLAETKKGEKPQVAITRQQHFVSVLALLNDGLLPMDNRVECTYENRVLVECGGRELKPLLSTPHMHQAVIGLVLDICRLITTTPEDFQITPASGVTVTASAVVLIDEPELHLNSQQQRHFGQWLVKHFPNVQFIVDTESPDMMAIAGTEIHTL